MSFYQKKFTIIELLAVVTVIMILAAIAIGGAKFVMNKAQQAAIKSQMLELEMALEQHRIDWGYYPIWTDKKLLEGNDELQTIVVGENPIPANEFEKDTYYSTNWQSVLAGLIKGDAWELNFDLVKPDRLGGAPYLDQSTTPFAQLGDEARGVRYRYPGVKNKEKYDLILPGPDSSYGTADDMNNWEQN